MYLIAGLGNPGKQYAHTYHNLGFLCIDYLSQKHNIVVDKLKHTALTGQGSIASQKVILAKPQTFMNCSGESIRDMAAYYKIPNENIIILYDDVNLDIGKLRIREKGSSGGHNGLKSIIYNLNTDAFPRIRIGIRGDVEQMDLKDYVLSKISDSQKVKLFEVIEKCSKCVEYILKQEIQKAMNEFN